MALWLGRTLGFFCTSYLFYFLLSSSSYVSFGSDMDVTGKTT